MSQEDYTSGAFNPLPLIKSHKIQLGTFIISKYAEAGDGFVRNKDDETVLQNFVVQLEKEYLPNPYHNFSHAVDVAHTSSRSMRLMCVENFLTDLEQFALLISAIAHDVGHPGVNNGFICEVGHELSLQYNDRSPLENMHCAKLYTIVSEEDTNVFGKLTREQYKEVRKNCIETVPHTDMMSHAALVKDLQMT